jgi:hypothetical protein
MPKNWWLYIGLLEKVFGLRTNDHSSYQRSPQGFNPLANSRNGSAQSQGIILHKIEETWEVALNGFVGNPNDDSEYRHKGFSVLAEKEIGEFKRLGASVLSGKSDLDKKDMAAVHYRQGLPKGSSILFEYGMIQDELTGSAATRGSYNLLQGSILLTRGYNLKTTIERYNRDTKPSEPDIWKYAVGIWAFPLPRVEFRAEVVNGRSFSDGAVNDDTWTFQGFLNVAL